MTTKTKRIRNEFDVLWDIVLVQSDNESELQNEMARLVNEGAQFNQRPVMRPDRRWFVVGDIPR